LRVQDSELRVSGIESSVLALGLIS
jgi:hypothetical protein